MDFIIITGMSGAGKTKAANSLEDVGYYCVDNIPPRIIPIFADLCQDPENVDLQKVALVVDARSRELFSDLKQIFAELKTTQLRYRILFLDASTQVLLQRYKETRRRHPLAEEGYTRLHQAIEIEREVLLPLREMAHQVIDTSLLAPAQLREQVIALASETSLLQSMTITVLSFGFRHGLPPDADLLFDVRCLPNPFYVPELRNHTGDEAPVRDYVMKFPQTQQLLGKLEDLLAFSVPLYVQEGKSQLTIAVGCTGGRHRSVASAERLAAFLHKQGYPAALIHRDKDRSTR